jgi:hypothetical protein
MIIETTEAYAKNPGGNFDVKVLKGNMENSKH